MLERVVLHQSRFRMPGVSIDPRGVLLGQNGLVLLSTIEGVVRFLRVWSRDGSLDDLPELAIRRMRTPLGTHEMGIEFAARSSYVLDRAAGIARLLGGFTFTGTSRHFVKYRDVAAPLGYDIVDLVADAGDVALYHDAFQQAYRYEREMPIRELVERLTPTRDEDPAPPDTLLLLARRGLGPAVQSYLFRSGVRAAIAVVDRPSRSAFSDAPERLHLFRASEVPERIVALLRDTPGITVFVPVLDHVAVELGYRHPIALEACTSIFDEERLTLFSGRGPVEVLDEPPAFTPLEALSAVELREPSAEVVQSDASAAADVSVAVRVRLAPTQAPWSRIVATIVPPSQGTYLRKLVYALPPSALREYRIFVTKDCAVLVNPRGMDTVPLGSFYSEYGSHVYVPAGFTLLPAVAPDILRKALGDEPGVHYFFELGDREGHPLAVRDVDLVPLSQRAVLPLATRTLEPSEEALAHELPPEVLHSPIGVFPLWGVPGKSPTRKV